MENAITRQRSGKFSLITKVWPAARLDLNNFDYAEYDDFFEHMQRVDKLLHYHDHRFAVQSLDDILKLSDKAREMKSSRLSEVIDSLLLERFLNGDKRSIQSSLELAVRTCYGININSPSIAIGPARPFENRLEWAPNQSLEKLIETNLGTDPKAGNATRQTRLDSKFSAAYLVKTCGMQLHWTDNLTDHLRHGERNVIVVYKHKICLINHLKSGSHCPIPRAALTEALDTLNLLFPAGDTSTRQLLIDEGKLSFYQLGNYGRERELDLCHYENWSERLQPLVRIYESPARSWKQLATDRRNLMEWAAFWVAVMVAFLTVVSVPCNIIQATYSIKAYRATITQATSCAC
ncbi:hypothetical protein EJ04DRAFT_588685 [Polyplosphaeria fusca]|uniref:Uncharacterized protein n=1 Tax=Polyplosphaeria fusca TaxID=682080 RepID=A0A9P4QR10_9PLEO|nr:hypothetical protein EJ04DRAFT_588685 [Polyplosphaeria fusca]